MKFKFTKKPSEPPKAVTFLKRAPWVPGTTPPADNVLIGGIGMFDWVSVVGRESKSDQLYYATNCNDPYEVIADLEGFIELIKEREGID